MCIRDRYKSFWENSDLRIHVIGKDIIKFHGIYWPAMLMSCLLYTSDAADERSSVDLGGRRIIKKKTHKEE